MIDPETKTTLVHGHFDSEPVPVTAGSFMHAHIFAEETEALVVPSTAVVREGESAFVFVHSGGSFKKQPVTLGRIDGDYIEITDLDLDGKEQLALRGAYYINGSINGED
jgi:multidrug efflux pump subunit AcrA (membrane-fusion protein)